MTASHNKPLPLYTHEISDQVIDLHVAGPCWISIFYGLDYRFSHFAKGEKPFFKLGAPTGGQNEMR